MEKRRFFIFPSCLHLKTNFRHQLRDACEKLIFKYPLEYGKKTEELLWRKVYYEVIQLIKTNKKVPRSNQTRDEIEAPLKFNCH